LSGFCQDTLTQLLYKDSRFQFSRLESLLRQAARAPGRSVLSTTTADGSTQPGSPLEVGCLTTGLTTALATTTCLLVPGR